MAALEPSVTWAGECFSMRQHYRTDAHGRQHVPEEAPPRDVRVHVEPEAQGDRVDVHVGHKQEIEPPGHLDRTHQPEDRDDARYQREGDAGGLQIPCGMPSETAGNIRRHRPEHYGEDDLLNDPDGDGELPVPLLGHVDHSDTPRYSRESTNFFPFM